MRPAHGRTDRGALFGFAQVECRGHSGPADGRYPPARRSEAPDAPATQVLVLATLGAAERRRLARSAPAGARRSPGPTRWRPDGRRSSSAPSRFADEGAPALADGAGEDALAAGARGAQPRAACAFRRSPPTPAARGRPLLGCSRRGSATARASRSPTAVGAARELGPAGARRRRACSRRRRDLAAVLGGRERPWSVRGARAASASGPRSGSRPREAALQLLVALDAGAAPNSDGSPRSWACRAGVAELRDRRAAVDAAAAQAALTTARSARAERGGGGDGGAPRSGAAGARLCARPRPSAG